MWKGGVGWGGGLYEKKIEVFKSFSSTWSPCFVLLYYAKFALLLFYCFLLHDVRFLGTTLTSTSIYIHTHTHLPITHWNQIIKSQLHYVHHYHRESTDRKSHLPKSRVLIRSGSEALNLGRCGHPWLTKMQCMDRTTMYYCFVVGWSTNDWASNNNKLNLFEINFFSFTIHNKELYVRF